MQNFSEIESPFLGRLTAERTLSSGAVLLFGSLVLVLLAFIPLVPPDDALKGGGLTARGMIEFALLLAALFSMATYAKSRDLVSLDLRNPSFVILNLFVCWTVVSSLWSPNPMLSIAKGMELSAVTMAAIMFVTITSQIASQTCANNKPLETTLAGALVTVLGILIVANLFFWGTPLPTTGNEALPLHLLGEEPPALIDRPRLILAYAHPLLTGDFLALSVICLFAAGWHRILKVIGIPILLGLLWLADARGPELAVLAALIAMTLLQLKRNRTLAITTTLVISLGLMIAMVFQDGLLKAVAALFTDDVYTLNSRTELWPKAFGYILEQPITGYGYYASRYLLMKDFIWAGHAHNSFIEVLLTTGLVGLVLLGVYVAYLCRTLVNSGNTFLLGVIVYTLLQGMLNPLLFTPGLPMFLLVIATLNASRTTVSIREPSWEARIEVAS
jgi:O-antigen ligase